MANSKISALTSATTPLAGTETLPIVQGGAPTKQVSVANLTAGRSVIAKSFAPTVTGYTVSYAYPQFGYYNGGTATGYLQIPASGLLQIWNSGTGAIVTFSDANSDLKIESGNVVQGTAAKGINFTANTPAAGMTSQLLNWYEEGTWTATDQSGAGLTFTANRTATYIRIGSQVTAWFDITFPANASGASSTISLPIKNGPTHDASVCWGYITYATAITGDVARNQSYFQPCTLGGANVTNAALTGVRMIGTAIYTTI